MKIALLTYSTRPRGGVVHTLHLAEALAGLGHDVHVWTLGRGGDTTFFRPVDSAVTVHAVPFEDPDDDVGRRIMRSIDVLAEALQRDLGDGDEASDVVHAQDCISANAALRLDRPVLRTVHHLDTFSTPELVACHHRAVREPAALLCVSRSVADEVESHYGRSAVVVPNGVAAARFAAGERDVEARARWRSRFGRYLLTLGGIEPRKGSLDVLEAWALLRRDPRYADLRLVMAGGETLFDYRAYRADFDARAAALGIRPDVLGPVDDDALPALVAEAAALPFFSTKEGFGLAAMEALAAGVPVAARDLPVLREVLGGAAVYGHDPASFADALLALLQDPPDRERGRRTAASFTWESAARAHADWYDQVRRG